MPLHKYKDTLHTFYQSCDPVMSEPSIAFHSCPEFPGIYIPSHALSYLIWSPWKVKVRLAPCKRTRPACEHGNLANYDQDKAWVIVPGKIQIGIKRTTTQKFVRWQQGALSNFGWDIFGLNIILFQSLLSSVLQNRTTKQAWKTQYAILHSCFFCFCFVCVPFTIFVCVSSSVFVCAPVSVFVFGPSEPWPTAAMPG